jgi:two-component system, NtrC family, sensor histidine kinase HydH
MDDSVLHEVLDALPVGVLLADEDGSVSFANHAALEIMRVTATDIAGLNIQGYLKPASGKKETILQTDGTVEVPVRIHVAHIREGGWIMSIADITEIHQLQNEILKMDRLATVGELTSGIAHEIRNPLAGIKTTAQALNEELPAYDHRRAYVSKIIKEINRLNKLLLNFFDFAKPRALSIKLTNLQKVIADTVFMVKETAVEQDVQIMEFYPSAKVEAMIDPDLIQQVLMNICLNAIQAMETGGILQIHLLEMGRQVEIVISDTGPGIPENIRTRIFDPFFTTKAKGIGLGLSISYRIIKMHSGSIQAASSSKGSTFTIVLPREVKR